MQRSCFMQAYNLSRNPITLLLSTSCNRFLGLDQSVENHSGMNKFASAVVTTIKDISLYNCVWSPTNSNITLYGNQELAALSESPTNCTVRSVKRPDKVFQSFLEATFGEEFAETQ